MIKRSKLHLYRLIIDDKLELSCSAFSIFKVIEKKGLQGKYTIVREYCKNKKEEMKLISKDDEVYKYNIFLYVRPYSKRKFITLTFDRKQDTLFE